MARRHLLSGLSADKFTPHRGSFSVSRVVGERNLRFCSDRRAVPKSAR
jgi:hypothetical protein